MTQDKIKAIQAKIGVTPDGFWGPQSIAACQRHLRKLAASARAMPGTSQAALTAAYGPAGDESRLVNLDVTGLGVKYENKPVKTIRCNKAVSLSLHNVLRSLSISHPEILADYAGCYNNRPMRGGSLPSLHARGAAVDFCPGSNGNHVSWPVRATMPFEVMEAFAREGWLSAGAFWGRDAMHFQATC